MADGLTVFQEDCQRAVREYLRARGMAPRFEVVECEKPAISGDRYVRASFVLGECPIDLYIYSDEAGFECHGEWHICESQDYETRSALIDALISELGSCRAESRNG